MAEERRDFILDKDILHFLASTLRINDPAYIPEVPIFQFSTPTHAIALTDFTPDASDE